MANERFRNEQTHRKNLLNELEDVKGKIRVYCRVRPFTRNELEEESRTAMCVDINDQLTCTVKGKIDNRYTFNAVFGPETSQEQVFMETKRLVQSAIDGYNVCIFAYGQTGSGKTYTIQGSEEEPGITPRSINEMFRIIEAMKTFEVKLSCYMVEIYKGELRDLFVKTKDRPKLEIRYNKDEGLVQIKNVKIKQIVGMDECNSIFEKGLAGRKTRKTNMNDESSRSHLIYAIMIESTNRLTGQKQVGKISFIDLAGSESAKKTGTDKEGQAEANAINQSLSQLGLVITKLGEPGALIPYRDNLLTRLMQDSLGGNSKTLMFVNCSPSVYNRDETKNSLEYAKRVKEIKNHPLLNLESKQLQRAKDKIDTQS